MKIFSFLLFFSLVLSLHASSRFLQATDPDCTAVDADGNKVNEGVKFVDSSDVSRYKICSEGELISVPCPDGSQFNVENLECEPVYVHDSCTDANGNSVPHGSNVGHESDPTKYFVCDNGRLIPMACAPGTVFDAENPQQCQVDPNYVPPTGSDGSTPVDDSTDLSTAPLTTDDGKTFFFSDRSGKVIHYRYQQSVECFNYDPVGHPFDCEAYLQCENGKVADWSAYLPSQCQAGYCYPGSGWGCVAPQDVVCPAESCTALNNKGMPYHIESAHVQELTQEWEYDSLKENTFYFKRSPKGAFYYKNRKAYFFLCCTGTKLDEVSLTCK